MAKKQKHIEFIILFCIFLVSLLAGELGGIPLASGVVIYLHDIVLGILLVAAGVCLVRKQQITTPKLIRPAVAFTAAAIISLLFSIPRFGLSGAATSSLYLLRWVFYALLYVFLLQDVISVDFTQWGLYAFGTAFSALGLVQFLLYPNLRFLMYLGWDPHYYRLFSTLLDPNFAGVVICLTILLGLYLYEKNKKVWLLGLEGANLIALYLTYSRSSYIAFVVGILIWIIMKKKWAAGALIIAFILIVLFVPRPGGQTLNLLRQDSTMARIGNWNDSVPIIMRSPIVGNGFDTLRIIHSQITPMAPNSFVSHAAGGLDSSLLFVLATTGVIGLASYMWLFWSMVRGTSRHPWVMSSVIGALIVHSFFVNSLFYAWVMIWLWILCASVEREFKK